MATSDSDDFGQNTAAAERPEGVKNNNSRLLELANASQKPRRDLRFAIPLQKPKDKMSNPILGYTRGWEIIAALLEDGSVAVRAVSETRKKVGYGADLSALPEGLTWMDFGLACNNSRDKPVAKAIRLRVGPAGPEASMYLFVGKYSRAAKCFVDVWAGIEMSRLPAQAALESDEFIEVESKLRRQRRMERTVFMPMGDSAAGGDPGPDDEPAVETARFMRALVEAARAPLPAESSPPVGSSPPVSNKNA